MSEQKDVNADKGPEKSDLLDQVLQLQPDQVMPWEEVVLPSQGLYYDGAVPGGRVKVRPMGLDAEKILATQRLAQSGKSIEWLFKKCVQFDNKFDPVNLLVGDRVFLLYYLRGITFGNEYEFIVKCSNEDCGRSNTHVYDLNELQNSVVRSDTVLGVEPFKVVLPRMSEVVNQEFWVKVRFMRGYDLQSILNNRKVTKKFGGKTAETVDDTLEDNLNMLIVEAAGSTDRTKIKALVSKLHSTDTSAIREFLRENSPGIEATINVSCTDCGNEMKMELPITESFFRPTVRRSS